MLRERSVVILHRLASIGCIKKVTVREDVKDDTKFSLGMKKTRWPLKGTYDPDGCR